jgi:hypothetical protein
MTSPSQSPSRPSLRALLRRDYPSLTFAGFTLLFALGAIVGGVLMATGTPDDADFAMFFAGIFALFALGCGIVFARRLSWIVGLTRRGVVVEGIVRRNDTNSEDVWFLEVDYEFAGAKHRTSKGTGTQSRFAPGDTVRLLVDPDRPTKSWIAE